MNLGCADENMKASDVFVGWPIAEFVCVCVLSIAICFAHLQFFGGPNLCLLFDGFGFLYTTSNCMTTFDLETIKQILSYCASGFDETTRLGLNQKLQPVENLVRTGPLLPLVVGCAYSIAGKAAIPQYWAVATWSMWITQGLTAGLIWFAARTTFNPITARIAALIAIFYPAFILNSNRLSSETQACLALTMVTILFLWFGKNDFVATRGVLNGLVCGLLLAVLALARPPFLLVSVLLVVALSIVAVLTKQSVPFRWRWIVGVICGGVLLLAPWAVFNKILTGTPAITVDRFALYNLYTGLNARHDGFDVLPGEFVEHPGRFKSTIGKVTADIADIAKENPSEFITMMALKPARLLDSPWNDYQASCLNVPWLIQRFFHQLILALALISLFELWNAGVKQRTLSSLTPPIVFTFMVVYNLIHVFFISMARYTYPIMPVLIVLASHGVTRLWQSRHRWCVFAALLLTPLPSLLIETAIASHALPANILFSVGFDFCVASLSFLTSLTFLYFIFAINRSFQYTRKFSQGVWATAMPIAIFILFATNYGLKQLAIPIETTGPSDPVKVTVSVPQEQIKNDSVSSAQVPIEQASSPSNIASRSFFVVVDPVLEGFSLDALDDCRLSVNGKSIPGQLYPFIGTDRSQRDLYSYSKAFAHSGNKDLNKIPQWYCIAVPPGVVKEGDNTIEFYKASVSNDCKIRVMCDVLDSSKSPSTVSLREFSWSKGFTINPPLDMRLFERDSISTPLANNAHLRPRLMLISVDDSSVNTYLQPVGAVQSIKFDKASLSKKERMVSLVVAPDKLAPVVDAIKNGNGNAVWLRISGNLKPVKGSTKASVVSITKVSNGAGTIETMAPMAPEMIMCEGDGKKFSFIDIVPAAAAANGKVSLSVRLVAGGRCWWDVLQYGNLRIDAPVDLDDLMVEVASTSLPDLSKQKLSQFKCQPIAR